MYSRETFNQTRTAARKRERQDGRLLAVVSIGLGFAQLVFIRWAEVRFVRRLALKLEGALFVAYVVLVLWLLWRLERHKRALAPRCPQCGAALEDLSQRLAAATGRCDNCGGQVIA